MCFFFFKAVYYQRYQGEGNSLLCFCFPALLGCFSNLANSPILILVLRNDFHKVKIVE